MRERIYYAINESGARTAKSMNSFNDYISGSRTADYKAQVNEAYEAADQVATVKPDQAEIFPHEMGIFLEYPIEDVEGFIFHQGRNYLLNGYWKVYHDPDGKKRLFEEFEYAQEQICKLYLSGINAEQILTHYSKINTKSIY